MSVSLQHHVNTASYQCYDMASTLILGCWNCVVIQFHIHVGAVLLHCINIDMKLYQYVMRWHQHWYEAVRTVWWYNFISALMQCCHIASTLTWSCINISWDCINIDTCIRLLEQCGDTISYQCWCSVVILHQHWYEVVSIFLYQHFMRLHQHWYEADLNSILYKSHISIDAVWDCINIDMRFYQSVTSSRSGCFRVYKHAHYLGGNFVEQHLKDFKIKAFAL